MSSGTGGGGTPDPPPFVPGSALFLTTFNEMWVHMTMWATATISVIFFIAGVWGSRVGKSKYAVCITACSNESYSQQCAIHLASKYLSSYLPLLMSPSSIPTRPQWAWVPLGSVIVGASFGFVNTAIMSSLIAAVYLSVPYAIGIDTAAGLGIGQAIVFTYFHLGRSDFIHR